MDPTSADPARTILARLPALLPDLEQVYKDVHANPELSMQEHRTAALAARYLRDAGYEVTAGVGETGVVGVLRNGDGPTVMLRADMDALPICESTGLEYASTAAAEGREGRLVPVAHACGRVFANVLEAALARTAPDSDFLFASTDLSALFPEPALAYVVASGGRSMLRTRARIASVDEDGVRIEHGASTRFDAAIVAVGPHQVESTLPREAPFLETHAAADALRYEPIATVWLGYASRTPLRGTMARLDDSPGQWVVDRPEVLARASHDPGRPALAQLVAAVISAGGPHEAMAPDALAAACDAQLRRLAPGWPPLAWSQVITERRATYACTPDRAIVANPKPHARVAIAGDWVDTEFPATIEAAVRAGVHAAIDLDGGFAKPAGAPGPDTIIRLEAAS